MDPCILVPVLRRPWRVEPLLTNIRATTGRCRVLFIADQDDDDELEALDRAGADFTTVPPGTSYAAKINAGFAATDETIYFQAADDLVFYDGWYEAALRLLWHPCHVVGTNDLGNPAVKRGAHSTHSLFTREYIETRGGTMDMGPGVVMYPGYAHGYCDSEFVAVAKRRGVFKFAYDSVVEHLHPDWGKGEEDATYARGRALHEASLATYNERKHLWMRSR